MMVFNSILVYGAVLSILASVYLMGVIWYNPRLFLQDYPEAIQQDVPPKSDAEKRWSLILGIPFLLLLAVVPIISTFSLKEGLGEQVTFLQLFVNAFGVAFTFNLVDLIILDWLLFCTITPQFMVLPGTEGHPAYKDYGFHFRASLVGTLISLVAGLVIAGIVWYIG